MAERGSGTSICALGWMGARPLEGGGGVILKGSHRPELYLFEACFI